MSRITQEVEREYHLMFTNIKQETLNAVRDIVRVHGLFKYRRENPEHAFELLRTLMITLNNIYNIPVVPELKQGSYEVYNWSNPRRPFIALPKPSLVSFLHEFRHHMQIMGGRRKYRDTEVDARAWSISVFYQALPEEFDNAWRKGLIWYMPPYPHREET